MEGNLNAITTVFTEFYYWATIPVTVRPRGMTVRWWSALRHPPAAEQLPIPLMFFIHIGFCMYEVGASRRRNHMHTLMKNTMLIPLVTITFFFFGWWLYWAMPNGPMDHRRPRPQGRGGQHTLVGDHGSERRRPHNRRVLGGFPAVLLDRSLHRVRFGDRADQFRRVLDPRGRDRVGRLDHRRGLGLALWRLDGEAAGLSRCLRFRGDPCDRRRFRARHPGRAGSAARQVRQGRHATGHQSA